MKTNATVLSISLLFFTIIFCGVCLRLVINEKDVAAELRKSNDEAVEKIMKDIKAMEAANAGFVEMYRKMESDLNDCGCKNCIRLRLNKIKEIK